MHSRKVRSVGVCGVTSVEGRGNSQMRNSSLLQVFDVVCDAAKKEIKFCSQSAKNENRLWNRKNASSFSECMVMRTKTRGLMSVRCSEWSNLPATYLNPDMFPTDQRGCGDGTWMKTLRDSTISAVREDESRSTVVLVTLRSRKCLPQRTLFQTEAYLSGEHLQKIIRDHLEKEDSCLQIFTTEIKIQSASSTNSSGSQASVSTTSCGNQVAVTSNDCGSQACIPSNHCQSQVSVTTTSCGCQTTTQTTACETQVSPQTSEAECQVAQVKVDVTCQTDAVLTSDAQIGSSDHGFTLNRAVQTQNAMTSSIREPEECKIDEYLSPLLVETSSLVPEELSGYAKKQTLPNDKYSHLSPPTKEAVLYESPTTEYQSKGKTDEDIHAQVSEVPVPYQQELEYNEEDMEEFDVFSANEYARLNAMTTELKGRAGFRNEVSLADELAGALPVTTAKIETASKEEHHQDMDDTIVMKSDSIISVDLVCQQADQYSFTLPSKSLPSVSFSESPNYDLPCTYEQTVVNSSGFEALPRNVTNLADELALALDESSTNTRPTNPSVNISLNQDNHSCSTTNLALKTSQSDALSKSSKSSEDFGEANGYESIGSNISCSENNINDDVMLRVFGFDPSRSPFTVNGYPLLPSMTPTLDELDLPILEKKEVEFARTDDGMFVSVGRGSYGCVYLANMAGRRGSIVVKDYINQYVTWEVIQHEAQLLKYLSDTGYVPQFVGLIQSTASYAGYSLVQEYFGGGQTIFKLLVGMENIRHISWVNICCQLVDGLAAIHGKHVLLNDIKGDNVLVDLASQTPKVRYIDVGMATYRQGLRFEQSRPHTDVYEYLAPEVCMGSHSSPLSDIYSLGYLLGEIGRKSQITELLTLSDACTQPLPIDRMPLTELRKHLDKLLKVLELKEEEGFSGIVGNPDNSSD